MECVQVFRVNRPERVKPANVRIAPVHPAVREVLARDPLSSLFLSRYPSTIVALGVLTHASVMHCARTGAGFLWFGAWVAGFFV